MIMTMTMEMTKQARFVDRPRAFTDLLLSSETDEEKTYQVKQHILLNHTDYENFVTDFLVERDYIADSADLCDNQNDECQCLLITECYDNSGILVIPGNDGAVLKAAYFEE